MNENQLKSLAKKIARKYITAETIRRADVIRDVARTHKLNLEDSITLADCIVKGMYQAGKTLIVS